MKGGHYMQENTNMEFDEFLLQRLNYHSRLEPDVLTDAYEQFIQAMNKAFEASGDNRQAYMNSILNAYSLLEGEIKEYYFRAGFFDGSELAGK